MDHLPPAPPAIVRKSADMISRHNVVWDTPSRDATGAMPVGNGDIAASVYVIENGDLCLLLAKNDAYTYLGDIYKTGRVRISLSPNPFVSGAAFRQTLDLATGSILITADDVSLRIWADMHRPVFHVEIDSPRDLEVSARPEFWRRFDSCPHNVRKGYQRPDGLPAPEGPAQDVRVDLGNAILWYYHVGDRSVYQDDLEFYNVPEMAAQFDDPFRFNTFGNMLEASGMTLSDGALRGKGRNFDIRIHALTLRTPKPENWLSQIGRQADQTLDTAADWKKHCQWWADFWQRGWIIASDRTVPAEEREKLRGEPNAAGLRDEKDGAALVAQSYNVFRYLMACQSRGRVPVKFNGGLFTQQLKVPAETRPRRQDPQELPDGSLLTHEDDRLWGRRFTYQNQRLLYWPLLASGDWT
jgi:alpha-L-fucosidase 2